MYQLRIIGILIGAICLGWAWYARFRSGRLGNGDWLLASTISLAPIVLGIHPDTLDALLGFFSFKKGGGERLLGLLIFSNVFLYLLVFVALARNKRLEHSLDHLVRELAKKEFRSDRAPGGAPIYVIIPAYNESENIAAVLREIPERICGLQSKILVVVDGSTDHTEEAIRQLKHDYVSYTINRGGGSALKAGYELALEAGAEIVVTLDADGQHVPQEMSALVQPIVDDKADVVNGSRRLGSYERDSVLRTCGIYFFNWLVSLLTWTKITDSSNAFRAIRATTLQQLDLRQNQFHTSELLIEALKKRFRVLEVPINIRRRAAGLSKKGPSLKYAWGFTRAIISTWLR
jgi:hypothetical protein